MKKRFLFYILLSLFVPAIAFASRWPASGTGRHNNMPDAIFYPVIAFIIMGSVASLDNPFKSLEKVLAFLFVVAICTFMALVLFELLSPFFGKGMSAFILFIVGEYLLHKFNKSRKK